MSAPHHHAENGKDPEYRFTEETDELRWRGSRHGQRRRARQLREPSQEITFNQVGLNLCFTQVRKGKSEKVRTGDTLWTNFIDSLDERFAFQ